MWLLLLFLKIRTLIVECRGDVESISSNFIENIDLLTQLIMKNLCEYIQNDDKDDTSEKAHFINRAIAFFLQDLLCCINPTRVFQFISTYLKTVSYVILSHCINLKQISTYLWFIF